MPRGKENAAEGTAPRRVRGVKSCRAAREKRQKGLPHCYEACQVRRARFLFLSLKASFLDSFLSGPGFETFSWRRNSRSGCSSCYPCMAPKGQHQLTHTVTAKKRTHPISTAGRCQPQCGCGRVPVQILRSELHGFC